MRLLFASCALFLSKDGSFVRSSIIRLCSEGKLGGWIGAQAALDFLASGDVYSRFCFGRQAFMVAHGEAMDY